MEHTEDIVMMLEQISDPAFLVQDGIITQVNPSAQRVLIETGSDIASLLATGTQEYADFRGGYLALTLKLGTQLCNASVTRLENCDLFVLNHEQDQAELQSMALAAQELRSPLSSVLAVAEQLFPLIGAQNDQKALDNVAQINRGLFQMLRIIGNMSDAYQYSQDSSSRFETRDVCRIMDELFSGLMPLTEHINIRLHYDGPQKPEFCLVDVEKLERAVYNIVSNALKFTPAGGTIEARLTRRRNMLYLTVENTGTNASGLSPASFYRQHLRQPGLSDSRFGIGLGMVLIHATATAHGGTVLLEQTQSGSTRITMSMAMRQRTDPDVRETIIHVDYAGGHDHRLLELSESLPPDLYGISNH
ncbi:MAG: HAMP domain-containing histidine kinase [Oscillospiraceae bacterium]|nr:HAMP domain-containing histidine kinase [Oscillospiraceae bacterium]